MIFKRFHCVTSCLELNVKKMSLVTDENLGDNVVAAQRLPFSP